MLREAMVRQGVTILFSKTLASNDNSKNQIYLGEGFGALGLLPVGEVRPDVSEKGREILKAALRFLWLHADSPPSLAPNAQLILYPQYPEVRLSGLLLGSRNAPAELIASRELGRVLLLGIATDGKVIGAVAGPSSRLASEISRLANLETVGVFSKIPLSDDVLQPRERLLQELRRVHLKGWIEGQALDSRGSLRPCNSSNCIGYTLEAELGVARNGFSEPDYLGWELKASQSQDLTSLLPSKAVTLMTPEPDLGLYRNDGPDRFVREYGYPDRLGREDRLNFGGVFRIGRRHPLTGLTLSVSGYDSAVGKIESATGAIELRSDNGTLAAGWSFSKLTKHWNRKHAQAAYVPGLCRINGLRRYSYGSTVVLGEGTDFLLFLSALVSGSVYYDPALKIEGATSATPRVKRRSQFRIKAGRLGELYQTMTQIPLLA